MLPRTPWQLRCVSTLPLLAAFLAVSSAVATPVTDGSSVHDAGPLLLNITNFGLVGSQPGSGQPYSDAPSMRWPGPDGIDYLWGAGLWVGARVGSELRVTTGQLEVEFYPTDDPLDVIYDLSQEEPGAARYPDQDPDDDQDGMEDEDPKNGRDDDGDGRIDEDFAAIGDQHFRCEYSDLNVPSGLSPDHVPLGIEVVQQSFQWSGEGSGDFIGFDFEIRNVSTETLEDVWVGMFMSPDGDATTDGLNGFVQRDFVALDQSPRSVEVMYFYDCDGDDGRALGYAGIVFLDHTTDANGTTAPPNASVQNVQFTSGITPFDRGGLPTNDVERYDFLSRFEFDCANTCITDCGRQNDFDGLMASGPFPVLEPGQSISYRVAFVVGAGLGGLGRNAAEAIRVYQGKSFDRDGDPNTGPEGKEFTVRWLRPDVPVPAVAGQLSGTAQSDGARLEVRVAGTPASEWSVERTARAGASKRRWALSDLQNSANESWLLFDDESVGWPRSYELRWSSNDGEHVLDSIHLQAVVPTRGEILALRASPNPFNPRTVISIEVAGGVEGALHVVDLRGRRIRTLQELALLTGGRHEFLWDGTDDSGALVGSGAYRAVLATDGGRHSVSVSLVR